MVSCDALDTDGLLSIMTVCSRKQTRLVMTMAMLWSDLNGCAGTVAAVV